MYQNYYQNPNNYGYGYGVQRPQARNTQPLTPEQIAKLRQNNSIFDMRIEQEDLWRAICTHKEKNGASTLVPNDDGTYTCSICGTKFHMLDVSKAEVEEAVGKIRDIMNTIKTIYLDASDEFTAKYNQMEPLLLKLPALWEIAVSDFAKYEQPTSVTMMGPGYSGFNALGSLMANPYATQYQPMNYGMPAQPAYGMPGQQPMMPGYGMPAQPAYGAPAIDPSMAGNPMAFGTPAGVPAAPVAPAPGAVPPATAPAGTEVQQQQTFNV